MKNKKLKNFLWFGLLMTLTFAVFFTACDMVLIDNVDDYAPTQTPSPDDSSPDSKELTKEEQIELERTGRFLKLVNMPLNTQVPNVYSVSVANSLSVIGKLDKNEFIMIYREDDSCTVYLPLVYNDNSEFLENGSFYTAFTIHVDAVTKYVVDISDHFVVSYTDGRGQIDVNNLLPDSVLINDLPYLTIYNLPSSVSIYNFSNVFVYNQSGAVAKCADYSLIALSVNDNKAVAKIPLRYNSLDQIFTETGIFYVVFDINVDVVTRYTLTLDDQVRVTFINGNGYLDIQDIPDNPAPYLTVKGLPLNAAKQHVSNVIVYNSAGPVADCPDFKNIIAIKDRTSSTFLIPLSYSSGGSFFHDSGRFAVSFAINVDIDTQIIFARGDNLILSFIDGSAEFDVKQYVKPVPDGSVPPADPANLTEEEQIELERTGRFLKLVNMPSNTQPQNVFSLSIANSSSAIGKLDSHNPIKIYRENGSCAVYLPLVYINNNEFLETEFLETGSFYVTFSIHVDAVTKYIVDISDRFLVSFTDGSGQIDINNLPSSAVIINSNKESKELTEKERNDLENTGHFLKLVNMPPNTQVPNVFSVSVANSSSAVGKLDKNNAIMIYKEASSCTVYLPLVYNNDSEFLETGFFYVAFSIHVDAVTKYVIEISDHFIVAFSKGKGQADINNLPSATVIKDEPRYLTISNLPSSVSIYNFSNVFVHNQSGVVARCADYSQIILSVNNNKTAAKIPLRYSSFDQIFTETGVFYVVFDINVDAVTRYTLTKDDQVKVSFINGDGSLDIQNIPEKPVPYLTIKGLPLNATKQHVSNVNVYDLVKSVATCSDYKNIVSVRDGEYLSFLIPLSSSYSDSGFFLDSGRFAVSFTVNIDVETQISYDRSDNIILTFTKGSAEFDVNSFFGFFDASLTNINDSTRPIIKAGSSFDINGKRITVTGNYTVTALTPNSSCVMYLYAYLIDSGYGPEAFYEFSTTAPSYNSKLKGWYNGTRRALWKMIYLYNTSPQQFLFKTYIEDISPQSGSFVLTNAADYSQIIASKSVFKSVNGAGNPAAQTINLDPGVYVIELKGAGGGAGSSYNGTSSGGSGGLIREIITLNSKTSFIAFTGSGGGNAPSASSSGTFNIIFSENCYTWTLVKNVLGTQGNYSYFLSISGAPSFKYLPYPDSNLPPFHLPILGTNNNMSGGGGGGGGSGTYLYSSDVSYFLAAGGGGGGSGGSYLTPGGGGGAGGSAGPGAGGGGSGSLSISYILITQYNYSSPGGNGGIGGGLGGGSAGLPGSNGGSAEAFLPLTAPTLIYGGIGKNSYTPSDFDCSPFIPYLVYPTEQQYFLTTGMNTIQIKSTDTNLFYRLHEWTTSENLKYQLYRSPTYNFSESSGSGGNTASFSFTGHQSWLNSINTGGPGASPLPLNPVTIDASPITLDTDPYYKSDDVITMPSLNSLTIGAPRAGQPGSDGGNNRNSTRGGGASSGSAGSITIYKIY